MGVRICFLAILAVFGIAAQISGSFVRQEAVEMRALVRQVEADRVTLATLRTQEQVRRRLTEVERWASALDGLAPPKPSQIQPSLRHALAPHPMPRPVFLKGADRAATPTTIEGLIEGLAL